MRGISFLGDVFLPEPYEAHALGLEDYVVNFESPIARGGAPVRGKVNLRTDQWYALETFGSQPLAVCLANNHIMDFGSEGLKATLAELESRTIPYFGAGELADRCNNPAIVTFDGVDIALLGYVCESTAPVFASTSSPGVARLCLDLIRDDVQQARTMGAQRVIVSLHWGAEEVALPRPLDVDIARKVVDAGADAVVGHHAHVIQPWEVYRGRPVFYGLGNCVMPDLDVPSRFTRDGVASSRYWKVQAGWNRRSLSVLYNPHTGDASATELRFDGGAVTSGNRSVAPATGFASGDFYQPRFRVSFVAGKLRRLAFDFWRRPRLPRMRHVCNLLNLLRTRDFR